MKSRPEGGKKEIFARFSLMMKLKNFEHVN